MGDSPHFHIFSPHFLTNELLKTFNHVQNVENVYNIC